MVPVVDLDVSVSGRVILEPHQVERHHRWKTDKDHPLLCLLEEESERETERRKGEEERREEEGGERKREERSNGGESFQKSTTVYAQGN